MVHWLRCRWRQFCRHCAPVALTASVGVAVAQAAGLGLKPGLWEVRLVRQIVDGHDVSAQLTESIAKAQVALSHLTPEERQHVQAMLDPGGAKPGDNASFRICVSPAMAASDLPIIEKDGGCQPVMLSRDGHHTAFRIDCTAGGTHMQGRGEAISAAGLITAQTDVTTHAADGSTHTMHNETQMQFVSDRCGGLHPPH